MPAVEGYAGSLAPLERYQLPVQSLMVATEPLSTALWSEIGLDRGQAFGESSRQVTYGQRTADDRLVFGARGGYRFGGRLRNDFTLTSNEVGLRRQLFGELFPLLKDVPISHGWGGNLGMSRRFHPHMLCDRRQGIALAGGYGGEGVGGEGGLRHQPRAPGFIHGAGVGRLVVINGMGIGHQYGGPSQRGQFGHGRGAGAGDHQMGVAQAVGHVGEKALQRGVDAGPGIGGAHRLQILGRHCCATDSRVRRLSGRAASAAGMISDRMRAPWLPPSTSTRTVWLSSSRG